MNADLLSGLALGLVVVLTMLFLLVVGSKLVRYINGDLDLNQKKDSDGEKDNKNDRGDKADSGAVVPSNKEKHVALAIGHDFKEKKMEDNKQNSDEIECPFCVFMFLLYKGRGAGHAGLSFGN